MNITVICSNKKLENIGVVLSYVGILLLLSGSIPLVWEAWGILYSCLAIALIILGAIILNQVDKKYQTIGFMILKSDCAEIHISDKILYLEGSKYSVKHSKLKYEGQSNYRLLMTLGAYSTHSGINTICFYNEQKKFRYHILLRSEEDCNELKIILAKRFEK